MLILAIIGLLAFGFLLYCLKTSQPQYAVYGYLLIWVLCPKWARLGNIGTFAGDWGDRLYIFDVVNAMMVAVMLVVWVLRRPRSQHRCTRSVNRLILGFLAMGAVSLVSGFHYAHLWGWDLDVMQYFVRPSLGIINGAIVGALVVRYVNTVRKWEYVLAIFVFSGVELVMEVVLFYYLNVFPGLRHFVINPTGRFLSLTYLSFDTVGLVSIIAMCSTLYFAVTRRSLLWLGVTMAMFLPIIAISERGPLSAAVLSLCLAAYLLMPRRYARWYLLPGVCALGGVAWYVASNFGDLANMLNSHLGGATEPSNSLNDTFSIRVGLWLRALDIFIYNFPFGAGNGLIEYHMGALVPAHFYHLVNGPALDYYRFIADSGHITNTHNAYLEFVVENGIPGVLLICFCLYFMAHRFRWFLRLRRHRRGRNYVALVCIYSCMVGMGWRYFFESSDKLYFFFFAMFAMMSRLPGLAIEGAMPGSEEQGFFPDVITPAAGR